MPQYILFVKNCEIGSGITFGLPLQGRQSG
jgi:hypothetical protein